MAYRHISSAEAAELLEASPAAKQEGPWELEGDAIVTATGCGIAMMFPHGNERTVHATGERFSSGDVALILAAPDLARTVIALVEQIKLLASCTESADVDEKTMRARYTLYRMQARTVRRWLHGLEKTRILSDLGVSVGDKVWIVDYCGDVFEDYIEDAYVYAPEDGENVLDEIALRGRVSLRNSCDNYPVDVVYTTKDAAFAARVDALKVSNAGKE